MYLSRISLNSRRRGALKLLGNRHAMHAAVMSSFAPGTPTDTDAGRVLWRIDRTADEAELLVVSPSEPCFAHIVDQAGWTTTTPWATRDYRPFLSSISNQDEYVFRLTANPTHRMTLPDGGKRIVGHVTDGFQREWFEERCAANGFALTSSAVSEVDRERLELRLTDRETSVFRRGSGKVTLVTASFEGRLRVTDAELVRRALTHGIGRAKGYGCGLLTVLPAE